MNRAAVIGADADLLGLPMVGSILLGVCTTIGAIGIGVAQIRPLGWPTAEATITSFEKGERGGEGGAEAWSANPQASYRYSVGGKIYTSSRWSPSFFNYSSRQAYLRDTAGMIAGAKKPCWYNPRDPSEAYLENGGPGIAFGVLAILGTSMMACVILAIQSSRYMHNWVDKRQMFE